MHRRILLFLGLAGCNAILGIDEPTLGKQSPTIDGSVASPVDAPVTSLVDAQSSTYEITIVNVGSGLVFSDPPGIHCDLDCTTQTASFNRSQSVTLPPRSGRALSSAAGAAPVTPTGRPASSPRARRP
jgi:hypothetical protein